MQKKLHFLLILVLLTLLPLLSAFAEDYHQAVFTVGQDTYFSDGQPATMDAVPFVENGRTLVPVRFLALSLGVPEDKIIWSPSAQTVTLIKGNVNVVMAIGGNIIYVNDQPKEIDAVPLIHEGRTYLPARYVAEAFGYEVGWDAGRQAVLIGPPKIEPPKPPVNNTISMDAARNGTLQPPPGAVAPPDKWGFPAKAVRAEFKVGERYATVTRTDGSKYQLDLGTECVVVSKPLTELSIIRKLPDVYPEGTYIIMPEDSEYKTALYVPFIPVAEAFGVPEENIVWDGEHLAVFGYYGDARNYRVLTPGTIESTDKVVGNNPEVASGEGEFPLFVKDGVPMVGTNSVSDITSMLFPSNGGYTPGLVNVKAHSGAGWDYETGTVIAD